MHATATNKYMPKCPCLVFQRSYTDKCDRMTKDEYYECFVTVCLFPKMLDILSEDQMCHKLAKRSLSCYHPLPEVLSSCLNHDKGHEVNRKFRDGCLYIWLLLRFIFPFLIICFCSSLVCKSTVLNYNKLQFPSDQFEESRVSPRDRARTNHNIEIIPQG